MTKELSNKFANMAFVCSILVVFIHVWPERVAGDPTRWIMNSFKLSICKIAVPFFFVAAGYFLARHVNEQGWWRRECLKRVRSLVLPYLLWSLLYFLFKVGLMMIENVRAGLPLVQNILLSPSLILDAFILTFKPVNSPYALLVLWFLGWLSILVACSYFFVSLLKRGRMLGCMYMGVLFLCVVFDWLIRENCPLLKYIYWQGIFFFSLGLALRIWDVDLNVPHNKKSCLVAAGSFVFGIGVFAVLLYGEYVGGGGGIIACLKMFAILPVLIAVWIVVPTHAWNTNLVTCAFPIYLLHLFMLDIIVALSKKSTLIASSPSLVVYIIWGITAIVACILFTRFIRLVFPRTAALFFGNR